MKRWIIAFLSIFLLVPLASANMGPAYVFPQGGAPKAWDVEWAKSIEVLSERLTVRHLDEPLLYPVSTEHPKSWQHLVKKGIYSIDQIEREHVDRTMETFGGLVNSTTGKQGKNPRVTLGAEVEAVYVFHNTSKKSMKIPVAFSVLDGMEHSWGSDAGISCAEFYPVGDDYLPFDFRVTDGKKNIPTNLDFYTKSDENECVEWYDEVNNELHTKKNHPFQWIFPTFRYELSFWPLETKIVTVRYKSSLDWLTSAEHFGLHYDFAPIFTWGKGIVPRVDVRIIASRNQEVRFSATPKLAWDTYEDGIIKPSAVKLTTDGRHIEYQYTFRQMTEKSRFNKMLFTFLDHRSSVEYHEKTYRLDCILPSGKKKVFENPFPGGMPMLWAGTQFVGWLWNDTGRWGFVTKLVTSQDSPYAQALVGKSTYLPIGTQCREVE